MPQNSPVPEKIFKQLLLYHYFQARKTDREIFGSLSFIKIRVRVFEKMLSEIWKMRWVHQKDRFSESGNWV